MQTVLARQPIFSSDRSVYGYELLFRSGRENSFGGATLDVAAASTADNMFLFGIEKLTSGRKAFFDCTRDFLVRDFTGLLPLDRVVIEILETIEPDDEIAEACRFKKAGYLIALDDFKHSPAWQHLVPLADMIKVDVLSTLPAELERIARDYGRESLRLVAEKVETYEDFQRTRKPGYTYFLKEIAVVEPIDRALRGEQNELRDIFDIVRLYEGGVGGRERRRLAPRHSGKQDSRSLCRLGGLGEHPFVGQGHPGNGSDVRATRRPA